MNTGYQGRPVGTHPPPKTCDCDRNRFTCRHDFERVGPTLGPDLPVWDVKVERRTIKIPAQSRAVAEPTARQVVEAQARWQANQEGPWAYEILALETGQPEKVCFHCMRRAEARGLLESGVSPRTAWLTETGKSLLAEPTTRTLPDPYGPHP